SVHALPVSEAAHEPSQNDCAALAGLGPEPSVGKRLPQAVLRNAAISALRPGSPWVIEGSDGPCRLTCPKGRVLRRLVRPTCYDRQPTEQQHRRESFNRTGWATMQMRWARIQTPAQPCAIVPLTGPNDVPGGRQARNASRQASVYG